VNEVWDLYHEVQKRDRPSGTAYAEIEDDATDQVLYCTAPPGEELDRLLTDLIGRAGLAVVALDDATRESAPASARRAILSPREVKGLDFHSVCVLNGGQQLERILKAENRYAAGASDIDSIRRRLAIDELRVALSRPSERLIWLDVNPTPTIVRNTLAFLNRHNFSNPVSPTVPEGLLKALAEEQLDAEERVQRCINDARQLLSVRPELAWSRMQQAVSLLGDLRNPAAVHDISVRHAVRLTQAEISFVLAFRQVSLPPELGRPDLFGEASIAARSAGKEGLARVIEGVAEVVRNTPGHRSRPLARLAEWFHQHKEEVEPWLRVEIAGKVQGWVSEYESAIVPGEHTAVLVSILADWLVALQLPDADERRQRLFERSARMFMKGGRHAQALVLLRSSPERRLDLEAECLEGTGEFAAAAAAYRGLGKREQALACYRALPDFEAAAALIREIGDHPAAESYEWLGRMRELLAARPENFNKVMKPSEKKLLEALLEQALGVARKKPVARKARAPQKKSGL
jgi:hypothetical protein